MTCIYDINKGMILRIIATIISFIYLSQIYKGNNLYLILPILLRYNLSRSNIKYKIKYENQSTILSLNW
jgi:hypothetical protein